MLTRLRLSDLVDRHHVTAGVLPEKRDLGPIVQVRIDLIFNEPVLNVFDEDSRTPEFVRLRLGLRLGGLISETGMNVLEKIRRQRQQVIGDRSRLSGSLRRNE